MDRFTLVTGASGFLGQYLVDQLVAKTKVIGLFNRTPIDNNSILAKKTNLLLPQELDQIFNNYSISNVIHCAAMANPDLCYRHPEESYKINVEISELIAQTCKARAIPFIFISSDSVFDGQRAPYSENSQANPINLYGKQKQEAERKVLSVLPGAIICRLPKIFGVGNSSTLFSRIYDCLSNGKHIKLFFDMFRTPISGFVAARGIIWAMNNVDGLIHLGGNERISWYNFGKLMAEMYHFDESLVINTSMHVKNGEYKRPADVSLDSTKAFSMGFDCPSLTNQISEVIQSEGINHIN